jgi:hypothetical protein
MEPDKVLRRALRDRGRLGRPGISVFAGHPESTIAELLVDAAIPHGQYRRSTVGRIRAAGFEVRRTGSWPHCTVYLTDAADEAQAQALVDCFDEPEPNLPRTRGGRHEGDRGRFQ